MKRNIYEIITEQVIKGLEKGGTKWLKTWSGSTKNMCISHSTGKVYRGVNQMLLSWDRYSNEYQSQEYVTFRQATNLDAKIIKGSKSQIVVNWRVSYYTTDDKGKRIYTKTATDKKGEQKVMTPSYYRVFNLDCIEGLEDKHSINEVAKGTIFEPIKDADLVYDNMRKKPKLTHTDNVGCFYVPSRHSVTMSSPETFVTSSDYYKTFFHELIHSTGHETILNRKSLNTTNSNKIAYSKEELVAELGAMFLTNILGLEPKDSERNSQAYINGWISFLKNNPKEIMFASSQSQKAVEYILNR